MRRATLTVVLCSTTIAAMARAEDPHHGGDHMMSAARHGKFLLDKFEAGDDGSQHWDAQAWYGGDLDRVWIKSEGEREHGSTGHAEVQVLYSRAISPFFDAQVGLRHDSRPEPSRGWLAIGIQGLAPYFFETEVTMFIGESGHTALRLKAEYDLLLTQRLILAPELQVNLHGEDDPDTQVGSGLSDLEFGLRLRYEIVPEFAPYIGATWTHRFGDTAQLARAHGDDTQSAAWVAGVKWWF